METNTALVYVYLAIGISVWGGMLYMLVALSRDALADKEQAKSVNALVFALFVLSSVGFAGWFAWKTSAPHTSTASFKGPLKERYFKKLLVCVQKDKLPTQQTGDLSRFEWRSFPCMKRIIKHGTPKQVAQAWKSILTKPTRAFHFLFEAEGLRLNPAKALFGLLRSSHQAATLQVLRDGLRDHHPMVKHAGHRVAILHLLKVYSPSLSGLFKAIQARPVDYQHILGEGAFWLAQSQGNQKVSSLLQKAIKLCLTQKKQMRVCELMMERLVHFRRSARLWGEKQTSGDKQDVVSWKISRWRPALLREKRLTQLLQSGRGGTSNEKGSVENIRRVSFTKGKEGQTIVKSLGKLGQVLTTQQRDVLWKQLSSADTRSLGWLLLTLPAGDQTMCVRQTWSLPAPSWHRAKKPYDSVAYSVAERCERAHRLPVGVTTQLLDKKWPAVIRAGRASDFYKVTYVDHGSILIPFSSYQRSLDGALETMPIKQGLWPRPSAGRSVLLIGPLPVGEDTFSYGGIKRTVDVKDDKTEQISFAK